MANTTNVRETIFNAFAEAAKGRDVEAIITVMQDIYDGIYDAGWQMMNDNELESSMHKAGRMLNDTAMFKLDYITDRDWEEWNAVRSAKANEDLRLKELHDLHNDLVNEPKEVTKEDIIKLFNTLKDELIEAFNREHKVESNAKPYRGIEGTEVTLDNNGKMITLRYKGKDYDADEVDYALWVMFAEGDDAGADEMFNDYCARKLDEALARL